MIPLLAIVGVRLALANVVEWHRQTLQQLHSSPSPVQCASYMCADSPLASEQCVMYVKANNTYLLQECKSTEVCIATIDIQSNVTCIPAIPSSPPKFPGSPCQTVSDCPYLNQCVNNVCHGGTQGAPCTVESTCDVGFVCYRPGSQAYCNAQLNFGAHCNGYIDDTLCRNDAVCGLFTCVPWFSLSDGQYTTSAYAELACKSGFYVPLTGRSDIVMCAPAPKSPVGQLPQQCTPGSMCQSQDGRYSLPCQCGYNANGLAYCPLFPGDDVYRNYIDLLQQYSTGLASCAFIAIGEMQCGASTQLWNAVNLAHATVSYWGQTEGNDDCVKAIFTQAYWNETTPNSAIWSISE